MRSPRLLIADGDAAFAAGLAEVAGSLGLAAVAVPDGGAFRSRLRSADPDIVALEVFLREADGLELIEWLGRRGRRPPTLLFTLRDDLYLRAGECMAILHGFPLLLAVVKPADPATLGETLRCLASAAARAANRAAPGRRPARASAFIKVTGY